MLRDVEGCREIREGRREVREGRQGYMKAGKMNICRGRKAGKGQLRESET